MRSRVLGNSVLSSTPAFFIPPGRQLMTQEISSWAMKHSASSINRTVRPNGPVEAHRSFRSYQQSTSNLPSDPVGGNRATKAPDPAR